MTKSYFKGTASAVMRAPSQRCNAIDYFPAYSVVVTTTPLNFNMILYSNTDISIQSCLVEALWIPESRPAQTVAI